jgi:hypothetical protein
MNLLERVKGILLQPKSEWPVIAREPGDAAYLFPNYVMIVAAIGPLCTFIGHSIIGFGPFRVGIFGGLIRAIIAYVLTLVGVFVAAYVIDFLAGTFGARRNFDNAMRVAAYSPTAAWLAGDFNLIPILGFLAILGLYSFYLLHTGLVALMQPPADKQVVYTIVVVLCIIVIWIVIVSIPAMLFGMSLAMM